MTVHNPPTPQERATRRARGWAYGLLGMPLAFVALPLYIHAPHHYAQTMGVSLASLGLVLLLARALDALTDPWLGHWVDRWLNRSGIYAWTRMGWGCGALVLGVVALWYPPAAVSQHLAWWLLGSITLTSLGYSQLTIAHQSWGARLSHHPVQRSQTMAWREGWALLGVISASVLPSMVGWSAWIGVFITMLLVGMWGWRLSAQVPELVAMPVAGVPVGRRLMAHTHPWRQAGFRRLLGVFVVSGLASAIPATLVLFFIDDVLGLANWSGGFLAIYFLSAALAMPAWPRIVKRLGLERTWALGMALSVLSFAGAAGLETGQALAYAFICVGSGLALGADLAIPSALLAGLSRVDTLSGPEPSADASGTYFGWWNLATKLNLALAAGLGLPLLAWFGYRPDASDAAGTDALVVVYAWVPCLLKLLALAMLRRWLWPAINPEKTERTAS